MVQDKTGILDFFWKNYMKQTETTHEHTTTINMKRLHMKVIAMFTSTNTIQTIETVPDTASRRPGITTAISIHVLLANTSTAKEKCLLQARNNLLQYKTYLAIHG